MEKKHSQYEINIYSDGRLSYIKSQFEIVCLSSKFLSVSPETPKCISRTDETDGLSKLDNTVSHYKIRVFQTESTVVSHTQFRHLQRVRHSRQSLSFSRINFSCHQRSVPVSTHVLTLIRKQTTWGSPTRYISDPERRVGLAFSREKHFTVCVVCIAYALLLCKWLSPVTISLG